jgi:hypothetical protein
MGSPYLIKAGLSESAPGLKCSPDIIPDRSYPNVYGAGEGLLAFIRKTICPEANFNVKLGNLRGTTAVNFSAYLLDKIGGREAGQEQAGNENGTDDGFRPIQREVAGDPHEG